MTVRTTSLADLPRDGVGHPDAVILPDPVRLFERRAARLRVLAVAHPMAAWLLFQAAVADAQAAAAAAMGAQAVAEMPAQAATQPPAAAPPAAPPVSALDTATEPFGPAWPIALRHLAAMPADDLPDAARAVLHRLPTLDTEALARAWLAGTLSADHAGEAVFLIAALQVVFSLKAAALDAARVPLLPQRGRCPVCASTPVAGLITAKGRVPGVRYLHCGLCATAWNHVRTVCTGCGDSKGVALHEVEGGSGAIKAETCDACRGYAKMFYEAKDSAIEPFADDLGSLGLDLMVSEAGWSRLAPNPMIAGVS